MGTWGTGIFADDTAADVRDDWRESILDGLTPTEATARVLARYNAEAADPDEGPVVWLALAAAQHETGRLLRDVRDRALAIVQAGDDVRRFAAQNAAMGRQRGKALDALATKLRGPARAPTRMVRPRPFLSPLEIGDVVRVPGDDGSTRALLVVVGTLPAHPPGSTQPVFATLLWTGPAMPNAAAMAQLPLLLDDSQLQYDKQSRPVLSLHAVLSPPKGKLTMPGSVEVVARGVPRRDIPDPREWNQRHGPKVRYTSWALLGAWVGGKSFGGTYQHQVELTSQIATGRHWPRLPRFLRAK